MKVKGIRWVGVGTERISEMRGFATEVLGLRLLAQDREDFVELALDDGSKLELFASSAVADAPSTLASNPVVAGFLVDDIQAARDELAQTPGVQLLGELCAMPDGYAWQAFRAPDGHVYEVVADPSGHRPSMDARRASMPAPLIEFPADDPDRARRFWQGVLGVELGARAAAAGSGWESETGSLRLGVHARGRGPGDTAALPYFAVADLPATVQRVRELGGSVVHPGERWAVCRDSEGSPFALAAAPGSVE